MARAANRSLRLEPCEDRALLAAITPVIDQSSEIVAHAPAASASHRVSYPQANASGDDSEYGTQARGTSNPSKPSYDRSDPSTEYSTGQRNYKLSSAEDARAEPSEYARTSLPAAPPMPVGIVAPEAAASDSPVAAGAPVSTSPVVVQPGPAPSVPVPPPPPTPPTPPSNWGSGVAPTGDDPTDSSPVPARGPEEPPTESEPEETPAGSPNVVHLIVGDLDLQVDLSGWATTAGKLLEGLDAVFNPPDDEFSWARLGYWALAVGAVGVTVELARQLPRKSPADPALIPNLAVAR